MAALFPIAFLCLPLLRPTVAHTQSSPQKQEPRRLKVQVNLVPVVTSVLDSHGHPVVNLSKDDFEIYEEGLKQRIELFQSETNMPLDLALMIDTSLSAFSELKFEREAAAGFIRQVVRPGDGLAVFQFADTVDQLADFSDRVPALQDAVRRIEVGAGTALYDAVYLGANSLEKRPRDHRRVVLLLTDAGETTSRMDFEAARRSALHAGAMLYTILIRAVKNESGRNTAGEHALETITDATGGAIYYLDSLDELNPTFDRINRELRTQFLIGYYPNPRPTAYTYRHVEVRITGAASSGSYSVRHRKGYFSGVAD